MSPFNARSHSDATRRRTRTTKPRPTTKKMMTMTTAMMMTTTAMMMTTTAMMTMTTAMMMTKMAIMMTTMAMMTMTTTRRTRTHPLSTVETRPYLFSRRCSAVQFVTALWLNGRAWLQNESPATKKGKHCVFISENAEPSHRQRR